MLTEINKGKNITSVGGGDDISKLGQYKYRSGGSQLVSFVKQYFCCQRGRKRTLFAVAYLAIYFIDRR